MTTTLLTQRLDLIESEHIDDRLRGYYFFPIHWFQTGELVAENSNTPIGIFLYKTPDFGEKMFRNSLVINTYLPFLFEGLPVKVLNK